MSRRIVLVDIGQGMTLRGVLPSVALFSSYSARVTARGGQGPYTYTLVDGAAALEAAGIYLDSATGEVLSSGVALGGTIPLTIRATSITGAYVERSFAITVIAEPLSLSGTYPDAVVGVPYSADLQISGGDGNYSNPRVISGSLPAGLALSIVDSFLRLSGNATEAMSRATVVVAVDSAGGTATSVQLVAATDAQPAQYTQWRYLQVAMSDNTDYSSPGYDDSGWAIGAAPFGSWGDGHSDGLADPGNYDPRFAFAFATPWAVGTRLWLRRSLHLDAVAPFGYRMISYIEDNCLIYVNGVLVFDSPDGPVGGNGFSVLLPASLFVVGENSIVARCADEPGAGTESVTYADFLLQAAVESDVTVSLLHFDGTNGSTSFIDEAGAAWAKLGTPVISTAQAKFGQSMQIATAGSGLSRAASTATDLSTDDFTIEAFVYPVNTGSDFTFGTIVGKRSGTADFDYLFFFYAPSKCIIVNFGDSSAASIQLVGITDTVPLNAWTHVALVRSGAQVMLYVAGQLQASAPVTGLIRNRATPLQIGTCAGFTKTTFGGFIDEVRITRIARYTANFTPPTAPFTL